MNKQEGKIVFRRVRGRIIPIRVKNDHAVAKTAAGAGLIGAGVTIAVKAGNEADKILVKSAYVERRARHFASKIPSQLDFFRKARHAGPEKLLKLSDKLHKSRNLWMLGGAVAGGLLVSTGASMILSSNKKLKHNEEVKRFTTIGSVFGAASTVAALAYRRKIHPTESLVKAFNYAKSRNIFHYIKKGI